MPANPARKDVRRKKVNFLNEGIHFLERSAGGFAKALNLLGPADEYAQPRSLDQLRKLANLRRAEALRAETGGGEVLNCPHRRDIVDTSDELLVAKQVLFHPHMLAAGWAVGKLFARLLVHATGRTGHDSAVDNRQFRPVLAN